MKSFLILAALLFQTLPVSASSNVKLDCYSDARIHSTPSEASAVLCANVNSKEEIEAVLNCYFDDRLRYAESLTSALLCSSVKSKAAANKAISCYSSSTAGSSWASVLSCK